MSLLDDVRSILLDIEGTTTPIAFVHDVLFSYARDHVGEFLTVNGDHEDVRADIALLREEHAVDVREGRNPPPVEPVANYVEWLIELDRKSTGLKSLQGKIWRQGYTEGSLKSHVFADVSPALERWQPIELDVVDVHVRVQLVGVVELEHVDFAEDALAQPLIAQIVEQIERAVAKPGRRQI